MSKLQLFDAKTIKSLIHTIREKQVMLDKDLANLYGVETKRLNEAVKRNTERFPERFRFQLTKEELKLMESQNATPGENKNLKSQIVTLKPNEILRSQNATSSSKHGGKRYLPFAFTEQGVAMLSSVLKSETAVNVSIQIIDTFVTMRHLIGSNGPLFQRMDRLELKQLADKSSIDEKFELVFDAIEANEISPKQGIIFEGQIFEAHAFVSDIIRSAKKSITIIDNYIDDTVLTLLSKKRKGIKGKIITKIISKRLALDVKKYNEQFEPITIEEKKTIHDRFIIVDEKTIYHSGASLKDLGKKISAFSKFDKDGLKLLDKLK